MDVYGFGWENGQERLHYYDANPPKLYTYGFEHWHNSDLEVAIMTFWPNHTHPSYLEQLGKVRLINSIDSAMRKFHWVMRKRSVEWYTL